ncbi:Nitroreductase, partial [Aureobasidium melanogenum]
MADKTSFLDATKARRSLYSLSKESPISNGRIISIVEHAIRYAASPFNARSCRCIILFGDDHDKLWDMGAAAIQRCMPMAVDILIPKVQGFRGAYGTVLFFEDVESVKELNPRFAKMSEENPEWYDHSSGMHQYVVWTALEAEGLGCNLQHYQGMMHEEMYAQWNIPETWQAKSQLVFGKPLSGPLVDKEKTFRDIKDCIKVYGQ